MSVSKTILDEPFSLGGELGSDDPGARTDCAGGGSQVAQVQSRELAHRLLCARRTNAGALTRTAYPKGAPRLAGGIRKLNGRMTVLGGRNFPSDTRSDEYYEIVRCGAPERASPHGSPLSSWLEYRVTDRITLNKKRLTRKQVSELIPRAKLHTALSKAFATQVCGSRIGPLVYEMEDGTYLLVHDAPLEGRGDIYSEAGIQWLARTTQAAHTDGAEGRGDSVSHWAGFTHLGAGLIDKASELVRELERTVLPDAPLDLTYRSLDALSGYIDQLGTAESQAQLYDHLVAYVGETIRHYWKVSWVMIEVDSMRFPALDVCPSRHPFMPINVVYEQWYAPRADLRSSARAEVRRNQLFHERR